MNRRKNSNSLLPHYPLSTIKSTWSLRFIRFCPYRALHGMDGITQGAAPLCPGLCAFAPSGRFSVYGLCAFVVADFANGFRLAEIKRFVATPLPHSSEALWGPRWNRRATKASRLQAASLPIRVLLGAKLFGDPMQKIANKFAYPKNSSYLCRRKFIFL